LVSQRFTHAVTFKPNDRDRPLSVEALHRLFVKVHMLVDRALLGSRFNRPSRAGCRSQAIGVVEGLPVNGHLHGAFKVSPENAAKFEALFIDGPTRRDRVGIWRKLAPSGTSVVIPITEPEGWHSYAWKDVWATDDTDRIVFPPSPVPSPAPRP
jgi:hypothetical protein